MLGVDFCIVDVDFYICVCRYWLCGDVLVDFYKILLVFSLVLVMSGGVDFVMLLCYGECVVWVLVIGYLECVCYFVVFELGYGVMVVGCVCDLLFCFIDVKIDVDVLFESFLKDVICVMCILWLLVF